jgi:CDP-glycerol glycerophosphotransferase (TagB/SpsB family)
VEQSAGYPWFNCKHRICVFHGQPTKGNVYHHLNHARINGLFFYGPMMRDYFLKAKREHPHWPDIPWYETGQPKSDGLLRTLPAREAARRQLGLPPERFTVLYAPSFEYCSSLASHGSEIIESLLSQEINVIIKPHPAFYSKARMADGFNEEIPKAGDWSERIRRYDGLPHCLFREDNSLDPSLAIAASDVVLTDYSGIAFDGILLDRGMVYWDCPKFFHEYLPQRFGVDGSSAKTELAANAGRSAGTVVSNIDELNDALESYRRNPQLMAEQRQEIRGQLLFNPGRATPAVARQLHLLLGV